MLTIGLLGASHIAPVSVIAPATRRADVDVIAVASRSLESATDYARAHHIDRVYGSYESLLADPDVDLVYNALPPSEHAPWSIAALNAGKNVLCEKPFALNSAQARSMREAASINNRRIIEAFHDYYHPLSAELRSLFASKKLGEIEHLDAEFLAAIPYDPISLRHDRALGGGALMDLGCYPLHWVRTLMGEEPRIVRAEAEFGPLGADTTICAHLEFSRGTTATVQARMDLPEGQRNSLTVRGTRGSVRVNNIVFPTFGHRIHEAIDGVTWDRTVAGLSTYDHQMEAIVDGLATGTPLPTEGEDSVANMVAIDAIYRAAGAMD